MMKTKNLLILSLLVVLASCKRDDDVYTVGGKNGQNAAGFFQITSLSAIKQEADTASLITINLKISPNADTASHTIHVTTSLGTFTDGKTTTTVTADENGKARAYLKAGTPGIAQLSFTTQNLTIDTTVTFIAALPDDITLTADNYTGDTSASFNLTTTLFRSAGKGIVSDPVKVLYAITPSTAGASLVLPNFSSTVKGVAGGVVSNPYKVTGSFTVEARAATSSGDTVRKHITLIIK